MTQDITNKEQIAYIAEATWGTTPATPTGQIVRYVSNSSEQSYGTTKSAEITNSREVADVIFVSAKGGLTLNTEFSYDTQTADFLEGLLRTAVEAEPGAENRRFARVKSLDHLLEHARDGFFFELLVRSVGALVLDDLSKVIRVLIADGRVEGGRPDGRHPHLRHARGTDTQLFTELLVGRFPAQLLLQPHCSAAHLRDLVDKVHRQPDAPLPAAPMSFASI